VQEGLLSLIQQYIAQDKNAQEGIKLRKKLAKKPVAKKVIKKK
jgi:hypothetical protein